MAQRLQITARHGRGVCALLLILMPSAHAEIIGAWDLRCPDGHHGGCILQHRDWLFDRFGVKAALEVQSADAMLVPVVTLRGLPRDVMLASAMIAPPAVSLRFDAGAWLPLSCRTTDEAMACAPVDAAPFAATLPRAERVTVRLTLSLGSDTKPVEQERSVALSGTRAALIRLRAAGPATAPVGPDWAALLGRWLRP